MTFGFKMDRLEISLDRLKFDRDQMADIAQVAADSELDRLSRGVDANDQPARPLNPRYEKQKTNAGALPIRDMRLTSQTLDSFGVVNADENSASVGFASDLAEIKAERAQRIAPMIGLSPHDEEVTVKRAEEHFADNVEHCIVRK